MTSVQKKAADKADIASGRDTARGVTGAAARIDRSVTPATTIDATNIGKTTPVVLPQPAKDINYTGTIVGNNVGLGASASAKGIIPPPAEIAQPQASKTMADTLKELSSLYQAPVNNESIQRRVDKEVGIADKKQAVANLTNQINAITSKAQADQLSLVGQGRGVPEVIIGGQQAQVSREAAIQALPLQAQLAAAQGDLEMAQQHADTLFKIRSADAEAKTNQYNKLVDYARDSFTKAEQAKVDEIRGQRNTNQADLNYYRNSAKSVADELMKNGQATAAAQITSLAQPDPSSPTFAQDLQSYNQKVASIQSRYNVSKSGLIYKELPDGRAVMLDSQGNIVKEVSSAPVTKEEKQALIDSAETKKAIPALTDKINAIDNLIKSEGYKKVVGTAALGRMPILSSFTGEAQDALGTIKQLTSRETLDSLINLKRAGGTLGALSDQERVMLQSAATKIGSWEILDEKGFGTGRYNVSEGSFKKELETLKGLTQRAINNARGVSKDNPLGLDISNAVGGSDPLGLGNI
jgi:hypothetical protein